MTPMERIEGELSDAQKRIAELEEREAALAAHAERAKAAVEQLENDCFAEDIEFPEMFDFLRDEDETPVTSLARRDLIKQAEALEKLYDDTARHVVINRGAVIDIARSLREQAEQC